MKTIRKIGITIIVVIVAYLLLLQLNLIPSFGNWFKSKPLLIENTPVIVENIKELKELTTIVSFDEAVVSKVSNNNGTYLGNLIRTRSLNSVRKIAIIAKGRIFAGIDLKELKETDLKVFKDSVHLQLPKAKILDAIVNPSDCEIYIEDGIWENSEITALKLDAREQMIERAKDRKILEKADQKAKSVIESFLRTLGFKKVSVS
jgi:Protein of unknown function (DUF4230)